MNIKEATQALEDILEHHWRNPTTTRKTTKIALKDLIEKERANAVRGFAKYVWEQPFNEKLWHEYIEPYLKTLEPTTSDTVTYNGDATLLGTPTGNMNELKKRFEERFKVAFDDDEEDTEKRLKVALEMVWDFFTNEINDMLERVRLERKESGYEYYWACPNKTNCDGGWGNEGEYCSHCRRKLVKEEHRWETDADEGYNQAVSDLDEKIKGEKI